MKLRSDYTCQGEPIYATVAEIDGRFYPCIVADSEASTNGTSFEFHYQALAEAERWLRLFDDIATDISHD